MKGLMEKTEKIFGEVSKLSCIKDYTLTGGKKVPFTALMRVKIEACRINSRGVQICF